MSPGSVLEPQSGRRWLLRIKLDPAVRSRPCTAAACRSRALPPTSRRRRRCLCWIHHMSADAVVGLSRPERGSARLCSYRSLPPPPASPSPLFLTSSGVFVSLPPRSQTRPGPAATACYVMWRGVFVSGWASVCLKLRRRARHSCVPLRCYFIFDFRLDARYLCIL